MHEDEIQPGTLQRFQEGDPEVFETLVEKYHRPLFALIHRMVGSYEDARDLTQQVFLKAFEHRDSFDPERKFFSWIYRMAINESINHLKARRPTEPLSPQLDSQASGPERRFEQGETARAVQIAVASLSPEYRAVVVLRHFLQCSYRDTSEILQLPEKTVKSRLFSARQLLRERLIQKGYSR